MRRGISRSLVSARGGDREHHRPNGDSSHELSTTTSSARSITILENPQQQRPTTLVAPRQLVASRNAVNPRTGLLPPVVPQDAGKKCLVFGLDETLVHLTFRPNPNANCIIPVDVDGTLYDIYVLKHPGVDELLVEMAKYYEIVVFTAMPETYAETLLDRLDPHKRIRHRLYRQHCVQHNGHFVKDLSLLNRDIMQTIIVDNLPASHKFLVLNAIGCASFLGYMKDRQLYFIAEFLVENRAVDNVREHMVNWFAFHFARDP